MSLKTRPITFRRAIPAAVLFLAGVGCGGVPDLRMEPLPVYTCPRIPRELRLTGRADDPLWATAPVVSLVRADTGAAPRLGTEVRLLCSDTTLYIAFRCADDYVWGAKSGRDAAVWEEECVEVFVSPAGTAHQYYELNVSPKNVLYDACVLNGRVAPGVKAPYLGLPAFDLAGLKTAVHVEGAPDRAGGANGWSVEYAAPLDGLLGAPHTPPRPGDRWRLNLYRIDAPVSGPHEFTAWSPPMKIDFHIPSRFGFLEFSGAPGPPASGKD